MTSKLTKVEHIREDKKNFFISNILLKRRVSIIKIKIKNLDAIKDLKIGLFLNGQPTIFAPPALIASLNSVPRNLKEVSRKTYKKKAIKSQCKALNLNLNFFLFIKKRDININNNKFRFKKKFPITKDRGKM